MECEYISSRKNPFILHLRRLALDGGYRREKREYLCDGIKLLSEALDKGIKPISILWRAEDKRMAGLEASAQFFCPPELFDYASPMKNSPGPLFTIEIPEHCHDEPFNSAILLENVQDPGNVGTVIRTAAALGIDRVILCGACADVYSPKTVRATMGAIFRQKLIISDIHQAASIIKRNELKLYAAALSSRAQDIRSIALKNSAVCIGSEGKGLSDELIGLCDAELIIPMTVGSESLNAAIAATLFMWEMIR